MLIIAKLWIILHAVLYIGIGLLGLIKPNLVAETVGFAITRPGGIAEIKACYGGLMFVIGAIMLYLMFENRLSDSLLFILVIYLGFGTGRLFGIIGDRAFDSTTLTYFAFESLSVIFSYVIFFYLAKRLVH